MGWLSGGACRAAHHHISSGPRGTVRFSLYFWTQWAHTLNAQIPSMTQANETRTWYKNGPTKFQGCMKNQHFILISQIKSSHFNLRPRMGSVAEMWPHNTSHATSALHVWAEGITAPTAWQMSVSNDGGLESPASAITAGMGFLSSFYGQSASLWARKHDGMTEEAAFQWAPVFPSGWSEAFANVNRQIWTWISGLFQYEWKLH